jgi:hypothetical protein
MTRDVRVLDARRLSSEVVRSHREQTDAGIAGIAGAYPSFES